MPRDRGTGKGVLDMMKRKQAALLEPTRKSTRLEKDAAEPADVSN